LTRNGDAGAAGHNRNLIREVEFVLKCMSRLSDRFTIEKDDALEAGSMERLEKLMERSRTFFQPEAASLIGRLHRTGSRIREGKLADETAKRVEEAEQMIRKAIASFVSTPHRLIRSYDAVHGTGGD
jgi:hypothetical protein